MIKAKSGDTTPIWAYILYSNPFMVENDIANLCPLNDILKAL